MDLFYMGDFPYNSNMRIPESYLKILFGVFLAWTTASLILTWISYLPGINVFHPLTFLVLIGGGSVWWFRKRLPKQKRFFPSRKILKRFSTQLYIPGILLIIAMIFTWWLQPSTFFSGRDQGSIAEAIIILAKTHSPTFSDIAGQEFFRIYGEGRALNYPGFFYTSSGELTTQFPLGYTALSASIVQFLGPWGIAITNTLLLWMFLVAFYVLLGIFLRPHIRVLALVTVLFAFPLWWFSRYALSENLALALFWIFALSLVKLLTQPDRSWYALFLLSGSLLVFTRIEGLILFPLAIGVGLINKPLRTFVVRDITRYALIPMSVFAITFFINFITALPFYKSIGKVLLGSIFGSTLDISNTALTETHLTAYDKPAMSFVGSFLALLWTYNLYGLLLLAIAGSIALTFFFITAKKHSFALLAPLIIGVPTLAYLITPFISPDHPWMFRRLMWCVIPLLIFAGALFTDRLLKKNPSFSLRSSVYIIGFITWISMAPIFITTFFYRQDTELAQFTHQLASQFTSDDLILIDRLATDDGFTMLPGALQSLYNLQAVYFFNPDDYQKINTNLFRNSYLIVGKADTALYEKSSWWEDTALVDTLTIPINRIENASVSVGSHRAQKHIGTKEVLIIKLPPSHRTPQEGL